MQQGPARTAPPSAPQLRSMFERLGKVPDYRCARGQRYRLRTVLALAVAARLADYRGVTAFAQFAALLDPAQRQAVAAWTWQQNGQVPPDEEDSGSQEAAGRVPGEDARQAVLAGIAMDGKDLCGASEQTPDGRRMLVAAVEHSRGRVLGQVEVDSKTNEIPAVRKLACLTNAAISIIRCQPEFRWVPEATRHYAGRPQEALDLLLAPPRS